MSSEDEVFEDPIDQDGDAASSGERLFKKEKIYGSDQRAGSEGNLPRDIPSLHLGGGTATPTAVDDSAETGAFQPTSENAEDYETSKAHEADVDPGISTPGELGGKRSAIGDEPAEVDEPSDDASPMMEAVAILSPSPSITTPTTIERAVHDEDAGDVDRVGQANIIEETSSEDGQAEGGNDLPGMMLDESEDPDDSRFSMDMVNQAPAAIDDKATISENATVKIDVLVNDQDPDAGDVLSLSSVSLVSGSGSVSIVNDEVVFDPGSAYDHLAVGETAVVAIDYVVEDGGGLTDTGRVTVTGSNDGPTLSASLADQSATEDAGFSYQVPAGSFADADLSDTLTYTATLADGTALPGWLSFDGSTRTFSGTPANGDVGSIDVRVTATDDHGSSVDDVFTLATANSNDTPHDLTLDNAAIDENTANGTVVGTAAGSDVDAGETLSYSLTDDAGGRFAIDGTTGEITVADASALDHETAASHDVTVRVTDAAGATYDETFSTSVGDVNEGPTDLSFRGSRVTTSASSDLLDGTNGAQAWDDVVTIQAYDSDGNAGVVSYETNGSGFGVDGGRFSQIDYIYDGSEGKSEMLALDFSTSLNSVDLVLSRLYGGEAGLGETGAWTAKDADGNVVANGIFDSDDGTLLASYTYEFSIDLDVSFDRLEITATSYGNGAADSRTGDNSDFLIQSITHDMIDRSTVDENAANGTVVGTASGTDVDAGDVLSYQLTDDAGGRFAIDSTTGEITVADGSLLDYETDTSHDVTVQVTDAAGATYDETFTIAVGDVNEAPNDLTATAASYGKVATGEIVDYGSDFVSVDRWSLTHSGGDLEIDIMTGGSFGSTWDTQIHLFLDNGDGTFTFVDSNDDSWSAGYYDGTTNGTDSYLNLTGLAAGDYILAVADYGVDSAEAIASGDTAEGYGRFGGYQITLDGDAILNGIAADPGDGSVWGDPNGQAVVDSNMRVDENSTNGTVIGAVTGGDVDDGETLTYSLTDDAGGRFVIDSTTGEVSVADGSALDYETAASHNIAVRVTDSGGLTYDETFTVNLSNVNETPDDITLSNASVDENASNGTVVGTASGSDVDATDYLRYSLVDDAGGRFSIRRNTGEIRVADGSLLDYETATSHDITVRVTDYGGFTYDETFTINVGDIAGQTIIGTVNNDTLTGTAEADTLDGASGGNDILDGGGDSDTYYAYGDGKADTYTDTGSSGTDTIVLKSGTGVEFELTDSFDASSSGIEVIDGSAVSGETLRAQTAGSQITWDFTGITLTGVDQIEGRNADDSITGSAGDDTIIGGAGSDVIDGGGGTDVAVFSSNWADYTITESGGIYTVVDNVGTDGTDTVTGVETFRFADGDVAAADVLNDAPDDLTLSNTSVQENAANGVVVGTASGNDVDAADILTYSLTDDAGGRFAIDRSTGQITVADGSLLDYETATSHDVTVQVTDAAGSTYDETFTVSVDDVAEATTDLVFRADDMVSTTVVFEDFESGATGWSDNTTTAGGAGLDGDYLGTFGDTGGAQTIYKTFTLSGAQDSVTINFDFWEFDTWNGEDFKIWVDDQLVSTDVFYTQEYYGSGDSTTYGTSTSGTTSDLGGGAYNDQTHSYSFTIDSSATSIKLGFGASLDETISTESWGIDNLEIIENQGGTTLPVEQPAVETIATGEIVEVTTNEMSIDRWSLTHHGGDLTIDLLADGFNGSNLDSIVYLYRDNGGDRYALVGMNDDGSAGSDGSTSSYDSYLNVSDLAAGDYIIAIGSYGTTSSEAITSGANDTASELSGFDAGAYQITITGDSTLNGIATDPSDGNAWGDANGQATITSTSGGGWTPGPSWPRLRPSMRKTRVRQVTA